jgi:hypothetical protein
MSIFKYDLSLPIKVWIKMLEEIPPGCNEWWKNCLTEFTYSRYGIWSSESVPLGTTKSLSWLGKGFQRGFCGPRIPGESSEGKGTSDRSWNGNVFTYNALWSPGGKHESLFRVVLIQVFTRFEHFVLSVVLRLCIAES